MRREIFSFFYAILVNEVKTMEKQRCLWANNAPELYKKYHDEEWGKPVYDDETIF
ncbi:MAG: DNA-3-methyladenine glycosylase I, partial [Longicatena sp.]